MNVNYQKEYYERNKEKINKQKKECRAQKKEHYAEVAKKRYELKRDHILNLTFIRRKNNPEQLLFTLAKARAKRKNLPFNLELSDILIPKTCPLLEIELKNSEIKVSSNSPSLDRIVPELGYIKGNVWVVSHRANALKNSSSLEELELIVKNLKERKNDR